MCVPPNCFVNRHIGGHVICTCNQPLNESYETRRKEFLEQFEGFTEGDAVWWKQERHNFFITQKDP